MPRSLTWLNDRLLALPGRHGHVACTTGPPPASDSRNPVSGSALVWSEIPSGPDVPGEAAVRPEVTRSRAGL